MLGSNFRLLCQLSNPISGSPLSFLEPPSLGCAFVHSMESIPAPDLSSGSQDPRPGGGGELHTPHCAGSGPPLTPPARLPAWAPA